MNVAAQQPLPKLEGELGQKVRLQKAFNKLTWSTLKRTAPSIGENDFFASWTEPQGEIG